MAVKTLSYLLYSGQQKLLFGLIELTPVFECETLVYGSVLNVHVVYEYHIVVLFGDYREHVNILYGVTDNLAFCHEILKHYIFSLEFLSFFEFHFFCLLQHLVV